MFNRAFDVVAASAALVVFLPILVIAAILIKIGGGPIFYRQTRVGKDGKYFQVLKLRTMKVDADRYLDVNGSPTQNRITKVGGILRKTSVDELPQLLNILRGEMAIVGPRPILPSMLSHMTDRELGRIYVRPGITGLAQIKGRNRIRWSKRFRYDLFYIRKRSLTLDLWVLWRTIIVVLKREGVSRDRNPEQVNDIMSRPKIR